ncbi:O-linked N-acetylglucosamine transferase, SPINDLY family protein [Xanthobacter agilis]|uniref:O-linked N-acetylglucosamine transferase (SPINDLY family) n=1 Tax=Xanthobacter agilis TaxID=47492 RepID=A0ABU0LAH7_XANAG|nr:UDP-N-acetylglucosamine-peptide N-acetylglucosaminyltransferase [Xanthobacter agilis]MDQ0504133.1 putative O-linked N-acetylglucosamine transferase (SPINDLY family) [Xanthobacter agilis]
MDSFGRKRGMCEWSDLVADDLALGAALADGIGHRLSPFHLLSVPGMTPHQQRACSELWTRDRRSAARAARSALDFSFPERGSRKIRLGYLSNDFQEHATAHLLIEVLEAHARDDFEVFAYSFGADDGLPMRRRLAAACDRFVDISDLSDSAAAELIHADGVDILLDLKGFTARARTGIVLLRPAPVIVNYLGYPGTMGADICDYLVTDRFLTPADRAQDYAEALAYMPHTYHPHGRGTPLGRRPARHAVGLPDRGFVFCCFNQPYKISPEVFDIWCRLLAVVPDSVLWLLDHPEATGNLRGEAIRRGVDARRLVFGANLPQVEHLARLQLADLMLDTSPFNAHTTASDALWAGVPLVTCPGETFPSRVAGSILNAIGLGDLVAENLDGYFELAYGLATDEERLADVKTRLSANRLATPLFDSAAYTLDLESLYRTMAVRHRSDLPPDMIGVCE